MKAFEYAAPTTPEGAIRALVGSKSASALSGGTDLLGRMKDYVSSPDRVVYLKGIDALDGIKGRAEDGLTLGAGTTLAAILAHDGLAEHYPALRQATLEVGTPQIRNMATLGGNLLQRPRCWYYRSGFGLLAKRDGESLVRKGDNRHHAIFLTDGDALFCAPSSLAVPLIALGAKATILGGERERTIPLQDLYRVPKADDDRELTIAPDEILLRVTIPASKGRNASYEVRQKQAHDWPIVLASVAVEGEKGKAVSSARIVLYGVAPIPWRSPAAEKAIAGRAITRESAAEAGLAAAEGAKPLSMNGYKVALVKACVKRALLLADGDRYWEEA